MVRRPLAFGLAIAGTAATFGALWPSQMQLADLRLKAATTPDERLAALEARRALAPGDPAMLMRLAEGYAQAGRPESAIALIEAEAAKRPLGRSELALARRLALATGQPARALALNLGPHMHPRPDELTSLVDLALLANDLSTARRLQEALVKVHPSDMAALARARDLATMGSDLHGAIAAQEQILAKAATPETAFRLASLRLQANDPAGALDALEACPPTQRLDAFHHRAAQLAEWSRLPVRAVPHLKALYQERPQPALGRRLFAALIACGDAGATDFGVSLAERHPADDALRNEVVAQLMADGRPHEALELVTHVVAARPDDVAAHDALVDFALGRGLPDAAIAELARWVARRPRDAASLYRLAEVLGWQHRTGEARDVYERLFATCQPPAKLEASWRRTWAAISSPRDDATASGRTNLARLVEVDGAQPAWRRRLASACWAMGDRQAAIDALHPLVAQGGGSPDDAARLGGWLLASGHTDEGLALLREHDRVTPLPMPFLADAAYQASGSGRWEVAGYFFERMAAVQPQNRKHWVDLAAARESAGDWGGAADAWRRRLGLGEVDAAARARYVYLLHRAGHENEALDYFASQPFEGWEQATLVEGAELARMHGDRGLEERILRASLSRKATDARARLRLAELLLQRGARAEADSLLNVAFALEPDDRDVLFAVAAHRVYGGRSDTAGAPMRRLEALADKTPDMLALIADYYEPRDPAKAAAALDALHQRTGGRASGWLRRGELASRLGDLTGARKAWEQALALASAEPAPAAGLEVRARALAHLGEADAALAAWKSLAQLQPRDATAAVAIARHYLDRQDAKAAGPYVDEARKRAPDSVDTRLLWADWLQAEGRAPEALPVVAALRAERPTPELTLAEARLRHEVGELHAARTLASQVDAMDPRLEEITRPLRHDAAVTPRLFARLEHVAGFDRQETGLEGDVPFTDATVGRFDARAQAWGGAAAPGEEVGAGARHHLGPWTLDGRLALVRQDGQVQSPLGRVGAHFEVAGVSAGVEAAEDRWLDSPTTVQQGGREHHVTGEVAWRPHPALSLRAQAGAGRLRLGGQEVGTSTRALGEAAWQPGAQVPVTLVYQYGQHGWGLAGAIAGLPTQVQLHSLLARYGLTAGPIRLELAPGYSVDASTFAGAPTLTGTLAYMPTRDTEITLSGAFAGRSFEQGLADTYRLAELSGRWYF